MPKQEVITKHEAIAKAIREAARKVGSKTKCGISSAGLSVAASMELAGAAILAMKIWDASPLGKLPEASDVRHYSPSLSGMSVPLSSRKFSDRIGTWIPTYRKTGTTSREVVSDDDNGVVVWQKAGRTDLMERICSARSWDAWVKKHRAIKQVVKSDAEINEMARRSRQQREIDERARSRSAQPVGRKRRPPEAGAAAPVPPRPRQPKDSGRV